MSKIAEARKITRVKITTFTVICDAIWENSLDVAKRHFEKWLEIVRKLVYNSIELLNII